MDKRHLPAVALVVGIVLIVCAAVYHFLGMGRAASGWSEEKANERIEAGLELHRLSMQEPGGAEDPAHDHRAAPDAKSPDVDAARQRYQRAESAFRHAQARRSWPFWIMIGGGVLTALAGVVGYVVQRRVAGA